MAQPSSSAQQQSLSSLPFGPKTLAVGAGALIAYGLSRRSKAGTALATAAGVVAWQAVKAGNQTEQDSARTVFLVNASPDRAYQLWRNFETLPRFMAQLKSVRDLGGSRSEWVANGPMNSEIRWTAEITEEVPNQRISWRSLPGSVVDTTGSVEFRPDPQNRGTFVTAEVRYTAPGGKLGTFAATLAGKHPEFMVKEAVRRFKALLETGETPTILGQTHGPRGIHGKAERVLFRETTNHPEPQAGFRPQGQSTALAEPNAQNPAHTASLAKTA